MRVETNGGDEWIMTDDDGARRRVRLVEGSIGFARAQVGIATRNILTGPMAAILEDVETGQQIAITSNLDD